ncbi:MAG: hypothetical protein IJC49_04645 [Clostridia bacterium]|nr:hypothetical protein [Clostridia bacterium]
MGKMKMVTGAFLFLQAFCFLVLLFLSGASIKKKAIVFGMLAAGMGAVGTFLFLKGAKEYTPSVKCCCSDDGEDHGFEMEDVDDLDDIDCNFVVSDDIIEDIETF